MDLRCGNKKHGEIENGVLEIKCNSRFCGAESGVIVLHRWDISTGNPRFIETLIFKEPRGSQ